MDLGLPQVATLGERERTQHHEHVVAEDLDLGHLPSMTRVLDRERVQAEVPLERREIDHRGIDDIEPSPRRPVDADQGPDIGEGHSIVADDAVTDQIVPGSVAQPIASVS